MDIPKPIPTSRLQQMLGGARAIMEKVESTDFNTEEYQAKIMEKRAELASNTQVKMLNEHELAQMGVAPQYPTQQYPTQQYQQAPQQPSPQNYDQAMLQQQFNQQFSHLYGQQLNQQYQPQHPNMSNVDRIANSKLPDNIKEAMVKNPIPQLDAGMMGQTFTLQDVQGLLPQQPQQIQENKQPQQRVSGGLTEREIRNIIREEVLDMMSKYFGDTINEDLEKKLIQKLIKEGKLKTVPKKRAVEKK